MKRKFITTLILLLIFLTFIGPSGTRAEYGVLLECSSNKHYTENEQYTYYQIKVINNGDVEDTYTLTKNSPSEHWRAQLDIQVITIPAYESRNVILKVKPICDCESGTKEYINVTATSQSDESLYDTVLTVTTYAKVKVSVTSSEDYAQLERDESHIYQIIVNNEGSESDSFWLTISHPQELLVELSDNYVTLASKANMAINLTVTVQPSASYRYYEIDIKAESLHNSKKSDTLTITTIVGKIELIIQNLTISNKRPKETESIKISYDLFNNGTVDGKNLLITTYYMNEDNQTLEIGSDMTFIGVKEVMTFQKDFQVTSNFTGILIKAKIQGKYEVFQEKVTAQELGVKIDKSEDIDYYVIILVIIILVFLGIIILKLYKGRK